MPTDDVCTGVASATMAERFLGQGAWRPAEHRSHEVVVMAER